MHQDSQAPNLLEDANQGLTVLFAVARTWAISLEVFLHREMGVRYPGLLGPAVLLLVPVYGCCWEGYNLVPLCLFLLAFLAMCFRHRICVWRRSARNQVQGHSYYNGFPLLCRRFPALPEALVKQWIEPGLMLGIGIAVTALNPPLGTYFLGGGIALAVTNGLAHGLRKQQALDMQDSLIEQQLLAERFREVRSGF